MSELMLIRASRVLVEYGLLVGLPIAGVLLALRVGASLVAPAAQVHAVARAAGPVWVTPVRPPASAGHA